MSNCGVNECTFCRPGKKHYCRVCKRPDLFISLETVHTQDLTCQS